MLKFCMSTFRSVRSWDTSGGWSPRASRKDFPWPNFFRWVIFARTSKKHWKNRDKADKFFPLSFFDFVVFWSSVADVQRIQLTHDRWFQTVFLLFIPIYLEKFFFLKPFWRWFIFFIHGLEPQPPTSDFCVREDRKTGRWNHQLRLNHWLLGLNQQPPSQLGVSKNRGTPKSMVKIREKTY